MHDDTVWTRMPTGNDSDVIFPTIGHFSGDFSKVQWTVTSHSKWFELVPGLSGCFPDIPVSFRPLLSKISHAWRHVTGRFGLGRRPDTIPT